MSDSEDSPSPTVELEHKAKAVLSLDDISLLRRIKNHIAKCGHCREAIITEQ
jgi:hypothetical protein